MPESYILQRLRVTINEKIIQQSKWSTPKSKRARWPPQSGSASNVSTINVYINPESDYLIGLFCTAVTPVHPDLNHIKMVSLRLRLGGFRTKTSYFFPTTRPRCNSTRPPFNHASKFRLVDAPSPSWRVGDGLPPEINHWKEVVSANRKTWDFTNLENIR